jgi:carboxymethylenebutenolidase
MGAFTTLTAEDGHRFAAYFAEPKGTPKGGLVVVQEIFGVNSHIRAVADGYAADGYYCVAPALFDRTEREIELGYTADDVARGRELRGKLSWAEVMKDTNTAIAAVASAGRVGTVGYCFGGSVTWLAACAANGLAAASCYYGGNWAELAERAPACPALLHFGAKDKMIPTSIADSMKARHPSITTHIYDADHGFNCDQRGTYDAFSAALARRRTLALFEAVL